MRALLTAVVLLAVVPAAAARPPWRADAPAAALSHDGRVAVTWVESGERLRVAMGTVRDGLAPPTDGAVPADRLIQLVGGAPQPHHAQMQPPEPGALVDPVHQTVRTLRRPAGFPTGRGGPAQPGRGRVFGNERAHF